VERIILYKDIALIFDTNGLNCCNIAGYER
jgi:hypothetical protein